jgi:hypothetical protein
VNLQHFQSLLIHLSVILASIPSVQAWYFIKDQYSLLLLEVGRGCSCGFQQVGMGEDVVEMGYVEGDQFVPHLVFGDGNIVMVFYRCEVVVVAGIVVVVVVGEIQY